MPHFKCSPCFTKKAFSPFILIYLMAILTVPYTPVKGQASLKNLFASSSPTTVSVTSTVTFTVALNSNVVNGYISITIPSPGSFTPTTTLSKCSTSTTSITVTACTITSNSARFDFTVSNGVSISTLVFKAGNFINPFSTSSIPNLSGSYYDSTPTLQAYSTGYTMNGFTATVMTTTPTFTSSSQLIGAVGQTLTVQFVTMGELPSTGVIQLVFPAYTATKEYIQSSTPTCIGTLVLKTTLACTYTSQNHTLSIINVLTSTQSFGGVTMAFSVDNFRNPYSGIPRSGFTLSTMDQYFGSIDYSSSPTITVSTFASFTNPSMERLDGVTTVGEDSIIMPYFELGTLPIDSSCRFRIDFPSDMPITSVLTSVQGSGLFSSTGSFYSKSSTLNYLEVNGCSFSTTEDPSDVGLIFLNTVANKNYVQQTGTFTFTLYAMSGATYYNIAQQTSSLTFNDFTPGVIDSFTVTPVTTYNVQSATTFIVTMAPDTDTQASSKIVIAFPSSITLNSGTCTLSSTTGAISSSPSSCVVSANTLTITNPFGSSSYSASSGSFSFTFTTGSSAGTNPISSTSTIGTFTVNTYAIVNSASYQIDSSTFQNLYTAVATQMTASAAVDNTVACTSGSTYTLTINNLKTIPQNGLLQIIYPSQIQLSGSALTSCKVTLNSVTTSLSTSTGCVVGSTSPVTINVSGAFSSAWSAGSFTVSMTGLTNPSSSSSTGSFTIYTMDSSSNKIEYVNAGITVQMTSLSPLTAFTPSLSSSVNGATGKILISITVNCPITTGAVVYFTVPSQITVPSSPSCPKVSGSGLSSVSCASTSNSVTATLTLSSTLSSGTTFSFYVSGVTNPPSTCVTSAFTSISIYDSSGNQINSYTGTAPTVQTTTPATATGSLSQASELLSTSNDYTITYTNIDVVPAGSTFQIGYPSIVTVPSSLSDCFVQVGGSSYGMSCTPNSSLRIIYVTSNSGITSSLSSGSSIAITFGPITNPNAYVASPTSFTMTSYTDSTYSCSIDTVTSGLTVAFLCNDPCYTCLTTNKNACLSCNPSNVNGYYYLSSSTCVAACPTGTYPDSNDKCQSCLTQCLTCTSGTQCTTCSTSGTYPILYNNNCISSCPTGYYQATGTYTCSQCDSSCLTCSGTSTSCTSCSSSGSYPILYSSSCVTSCPSGYVNINYVCTQCTSPCLTCTVLATECTTCIGSYYLYSSSCYSTCPSGTVGVTTTTPSSCATCGSNCKTCSATSQSTCYSCNTGYYLYDNTCVASCPSATYQSGTNCYDCDSTCKTCSGTSNNNCLTCYTSGTYPYLLSSTCVSSCPSGYILLNSICQQCTSPCLTCSVLQTECTTCISNYYLYSSSCYNFCPSTTVAVSTTTPPSCATCGSNCKTCSATSQSTCYTCITGYYLYDNTCVASCPTATYQSGTNCYDCDSTCKTCSGTSNNNCLTCYTSGTYPYFLSNTCISACPSGYINNNNICQSCTSPCLTCSVSTTQCSSCISNYYLSSSSCVSTCPSTTVASTAVTPSACVSCGSNCKTCSASSTSTCYSCSTGYYLSGSACISYCPTGYYLQGFSTCLPCDSSCLTCSGSSNTNCLSCSSTGSYPYYQAGQCLTACSSGYLSLSNQCTQCTSPCLTCTVSQTQCVTCISNYYFYQNGCVSSCPSTTVATTSTSPQSCISCGSNCKTCSSSNTATCYSCSSGYYLYSNTCVATCPSGTYLSGTSCLTCDSTCLTCSGTSNTNCLTCSSTGSYPYYQAGSCLSACSSGYVSLSNQCTQCTSPCLTCAVSQTQCVTCISNYYFYQNGCVSSCPTTTVATTSTSPQSCISCGSNCKTCASSNTATCYSCSTGYYLYSNTCVASCPSGTYLSGTSCLTCDSTCLTCDGTANNDCVTCDQSGSYPLSLAGTCIANCPNGYISSNYKCLQCTSPCLTCSVLQTQCVTCISTYSLYENTCVSSCPSGTVSQTSLTPQQCTACGSNCKSCSATDPTQCTTCDTGYVLYNGVCVQTCPSGTYQASGTTTCARCDNTCQTCSLTSTNCTSCNQTSTYSNQLGTTCRSTCPSGYVDLNYVCTACTSPCLTCSISTDNCLTCVSPDYLYQSTCYTKCPSGTTRSGSSCLGCTTSCASCNTNTSTCLQCQTGYYLYNGFCYKVCPGTTIADTTSQSCVQPSTSSSSSSSPTQSGSSSSANANTSNNSNASNSSNSTANVTDKSYLYFPISTSQTILGGVALASHLKDPTSLLHSNALALWAPLEFLGYSGQAYLSYVQEIRQQTQYDFAHDDNKTFEDPSGVTNSTNSSRRYLDSTAATSVSANSALPLVFYGTAASFIMMVLTNTVWAIVHCILINNDSGYIDHRKRHCCAPICIAICSSLCNFKIGRLHHARFFGLEKFSVQYEKHTRVQHILNILTIVNLVLTLVPIIFVDIYGLIYHKWGNQFYICIIETLFLCLCNILLAVFEFRHSKIQQPKQYSQITDQSGINEESLIKRIDDQIRLKLGGQGLEEFLDKLREKKGFTSDEDRKGLKGLGKSRSCEDLNRSLEIDERRVNTDPLEADKKLLYLNKPNPFAKSDIDPDYPNNCYAELGKVPKKVISPANRKTKVIQTGQNVQDGDEYDLEYEQKLRELKGDTRKEERLYDQVVVDDDKEEQDVRRRDKGKMRGRKDRYYEQVDNEDMSFSEEALAKLLNKDGNADATVDLDDKDELDEIEEEEDPDEDDEKEKELEFLKDQERMKQEELEKEWKAAVEQAKEKELKEQQLLLEQQKLQEELDAAAIQKELDEEKAKKELERQKLLQEQELLEQQELENQRLKNAQDEEEKQINNEPLEDKQHTTHEEPQPQSEVQEVPKQFQQDPDLSSQPLELKNQIVEEEQVPQEEEEEEVGEVDLDDVNDQRTKNMPNPELKRFSLNDMLGDIDREEEVGGEVDSDDDNNQRIKNMSNPELRKFNVNDILGDFDRDNKGNLVVLSNKNGQFVDKVGNNVNEKGYLIDEKTGDVVEKEHRAKVFDKKDLDARGELPPPFNIERFNFNPHDVRGFFERDKVTGEQIVGNLKNDKGQLVDKLGRLVNAHGYLVDGHGNIVDKRGRIRLHHKQLDEDGNMPLLFNYKGRKFDVRDVIGDFDKDRKGNIIIRRDKDNKMVDKKGRPVNAKGYLVDAQGNIINDKGKIMFYSYALSKDNEIPKFFPFLKFNVEEIKGDFEMDPLGNPMLQKTSQGQYLDNNGRKVNEKGYLVDENGNIKNKRGYKVFGKALMEDGGDIPKVFRTGLFRKDTMDSFSQLMSEIEDLEKRQELGDDGFKQYKQRHPGKNTNQQEQEQIQRRIDKIVEEDNDDDDMIMKELEELAQIRDGEEEEQEGEDLSDGGNTSVDSRMEDTPSNYDLANQRFLDQDEMRDRVKQQVRKEKPRNGDDEMESESEYAQLPGKKIKRRKKKQPKKKKKPAKKEPQIDERDLKMAAAYGGMPSAQVEKLIQERTRREMAGGSYRPPINRNAVSNTRQGSMYSRQFQVKEGDEEDSKSDWGDNMIGGEGKFVGRGRLGQTDNMGSMTNVNSQRNAGRSNAKRTGGGYILDVKQNNLMGSTHNSFKNLGEKPGSNRSSAARQLGGEHTFTNRDQRLNNIANSVSGFYKEQTLSEQSKLRTTHESNFASNLPQGIKKGRREGREDDVDFKQGIYDPELERIYGAAQGFGEATVHSDWEKNSAGSEQSRFTQLTGTNGGGNNNRRIKGLENIYLQRLEPANNVGRQKKKKAQKDARFRQMQDPAYDENQWIDQYNNGDRDELDSVLSDNYNQMQQKFARGVGKMIGMKRKQPQLEDDQKPNIFHGNFYQYKEKREREKHQSMLDFNK